MSEKASIFIKTHQSKRSKEWEELKQTKQKIKDDLKKSNLIPIDKLFTTSKRDEVSSKQVIGLLSADEYKKRISDKSYKPKRTLDADEEKERLQKKKQKEEKNRKEKSKLSFEFDDEDIIEIPVFYSLSPFLFTQEKIVPMKKNDTSIPNNNI